MLIQNINYKTKNILEQFSQPDSHDGDIDKQLRLMQIIHSQSVILRRVNLGNQK